MLSEANPNEKIIRVNLLKSLEGLLKDSSNIPAEFISDTEMQNKGTDLNIYKAKEIIKRAKEIDKENTRNEVFTILEKHRSNMPDHFYDDLINFMRLHY